MKALLAAGLALGLGLGGLGGLASAPRDAASAAVAAQAAPRSGIVRLAIDRVESPSFEGRAFGQVGPYEKLVGRAFGEVDPDDPANADLALLDRAPRNARGLVEYDVDVYILKPVDVERGNHTLLYDVVNRGNKPLWGALNVDAGGANDPTTAADAGDGLSLRQGYTWVWSGWQGDAPPGAGRLVARFPVAVDADGSTIRQQIRTEFVLGAPAYSVPVSYDNGLRDGRSYPAVEASMDTATLSRRAGAGAEPELIPREEWSFAACADGATATPSATDVCLPAGFSPSYVYDLVYEAQDPPVMGLGFVATRDLIAFLRHDTSDANPLVQQVGRNPIQWTIGFGSSQSGRFLKDLIYQGFNQDPAGRRVFDGAAINISGGRRGFFNYPFAMPGRFSTGVEGHHYPGDQFPFSYVTLTDPISGERDSLLARCRAQGACPRVMHWDSGTEAWQGRHSLVVTDPLGQSDVALPDDVRIYYFASAQHVPGTRALGVATCQQPVNPLSVQESQRALMTALQSWVATGAAPPPSQYARIADGTLVPPLPQAAQGFPTIPGVRYTGRPNHLFVNDQSEQPPRHVPGTEYGVLVPKVNADGNDVAGVRSVELQAPLGTYTGWGLRAVGFMEDELCYLNGQFVPFATTAAERQASGDPRPSLEERYGTQAAYVAAVEAAARRLVADRYLLSEDAERVLQAARARDLGLPTGAAALPGSVER